MCPIQRILRNRARNLRTGCHAAMAALPKQTNDWGAVPSTLEAIYALLEGGTDWLAPDENKTSIVWGGQEMKNSPEEPFWD